MMKVKTNIQQMFNTPEIEELKLLVMQKYGRGLNTTTDFEEFSLYISRNMGENISASTLKRLWGYVCDSHKPRVATLDVLARYLEFDNYYSFLMWLKTSTKYNSSFFNASQLVSNDIEPGAVVEIGWSPNRLVHLKYLGESKFSVIYSCNSKMQPGDTFITGCFIKNQPLYLPYIERDGERTSPFVAGRNGGLTIVNVIGEKK